MYNIYFLNAYHPIWPAWPRWSPGPPESRRPPGPPWPPWSPRPLGPPGPPGAPSYKKIVVNDILQILHKLEQQYVKFAYANDPQCNLQKVARNSDLQNFTKKKDPKQQISTKLSRTTICRICKKNDLQQQFTDKIYQEDKCRIWAVHLVNLFISARRLKIVKDDFFKLHLPKHIESVFF